jgi:hypothetical protein
MNKRPRSNRRQFLFAVAAALGSTSLGWLGRLSNVSVTRAQDPTPWRVYLPLVTAVRPKPRVVHVRDAAATDWDGSSLFYNAVDQATVNSMVETGLRLLTGYDAWPDIWTELFGQVDPGGYSPGKKIAIKVNLNASHDCRYHGNLIDALPQPVLALISGMVAAGVQPGDVVVYDALRIIPPYLRDTVWAVYPEVKFLGGDCPGVIRSSYGKDPSLTVRFHDPAGHLTERRLADVLYDATYVVNMPIIKRHGGDNGNPVTLSFKNHFGSLDRIGGDEPDDMHLYIETRYSLYRPTYSPFVDLYLNPNIHDKTILILGDGLFGGTSWSSSPMQAWGIFGGGCNSLFFGVDPVATDCVMADLIVAEGLVSRVHTYDYLFCAQEAGLGVCEGTRAEPGGYPLLEPYGRGYESIEYVRVDVGNG